VIVFLSPMAMILAYSFLFSETLLNKLPEKIRNIIRLADPSGTEWLSQKYLRDDRGAAFYNNSPIEYDAAYLLSRFLLIALSLGLVLLASRSSLVEVPAIRLRRRRKIQLAESSIADTLNTARPVAIDLQSLGMQFRRPSWPATVFCVARVESRNILSGPGLWLFAVIIAITASITAVLEPGPLDTTILVTSGNFAARSFSFVTLCTVLLALFFGTDAMQRERATRTEPLLFSSPIATSAWLCGKALACAFAGFAVVAGTLAGMVVAMLWQREVFPEVWPLLCIWGLLLVPTFFFWSGFISLVRAITPNRPAGIAIGIFFLVLNFWANIRGYNNWAVNWSLIGSTVVWSDISQFEMQRTALIANRVITILAGIFLLTLGSTVLKRVEPDLVISRSRRRFGSLVKRFAPAILAAIPCLVLGFWIYGQVRKGPQGSVNRKLDRDYWKRNVATFFEMKSPTIDETILDIEIQPESSAFSAKGSYLIRNHFDKPIREIPVTIGRHIQNVSWMINEKPFQPEDRSGLLIMKKLDKTDLKPGESIKLSFQYNGHYPGGMSKSSVGAMEFILPSGVVLTSFSQSFLPKLGFEGTRGLPPEMQPEGKTYPDDYYKEKVDPAFGDGSKMKTHIAITVPADFRANSVGVLESVTDNANGTRKFVWKSDHPVSFFNIVAGRWVEAKADGVSIYHDARHGRNVPEMLQALEASRKYFSRWFGEFPWKELKLSEFPGMADYAQGFPTNITFSESIGFKTLSRPDSNVAFYVTSHEAAHQWWGNLLVPGNGPGGNILSESLANYSAIILMDEVKGLESRIGLTRQIESSYILKRQGDDERPLTKIDGQRATDQSITYDRGGMVFWMLSNLLGRDTFNKGLAEFIRKYPAGSADAPLVEDLIETVRAFAPDKMQYDQFVEQWIKGTALPNFFLEETSRTAQPDKTWLVKGTLRNDETGECDIEIAAYRGKRFIKPASKPVDSQKYEEVRTKVKIPSGGRVEFQLNCPFEPENVVVDPDFRQLMRGRDRIDKKL
ncbi:MAG: ABC transporter permease/M1 family aminopeptidase, partial [bacterium]